MHHDIIMLVSSQFIVIESKTDYNLFDKTITVGLDDESAMLSFDKFLHM